MNHTYQRNPKRRRVAQLISLFLTLCLCLGLAACINESSPASKREAPADKIIVGALAPLSGAVAVYGNAVANAVKMAVEEVNAAGGVLGKPIELILYDEKGDTAEAVNAFNRLKEDGMVALIGDVTSKPSIAVAARAQEDKIPMITPTGTAEPITRAGDYIFRTTFLDPDQGRLMADYLKNTLGLTKTAIISNNADDYSVGLRAAFVARCHEIGVEITADETYGNDDTDFKSQLTKIAATEPEALFIPDYYGKNIQVLHQAKEMGLEAQVLGGDGWDGILTVVSSENPKEADGVIFSNQYASNDDREALQKFVKEYEARYKIEPAAFSVLGFDAVKILCAAIEKAGSTDPEAIQKALTQTDYEGLTGRVQFDANGDPLKEVLMVQVEDGQYKLVDRVPITR